MTAFAIVHWRAAEQPDEKRNDTRRRKSHKAPTMRAEERYRERWRGANQKGDARRGRE